MKRSIKLAVLAGVAAVLLSGTMNVFAQRGGGDPAQARERQLVTIRERLEVASDDEWKIIQPRIEKVLDARTALTPLNPSPNQFGRGGGRGRGGQGGAADPGNGGGRRGGFGNQTPNPVVEALTRAVESNASSDELKQKLAKWREERKAKEADLAKAQDDLKKVLSVKQEAIAMTIGLMQ